MNNYTIGIDIGSTATKVAVLESSSRILDTFVLPTGWSSIDTANKVKETLIAKNYYPAKTVATGYGRVAVPFAERTVTEITCHAKGAVYLYQRDNLTLIDIGGQDTKVIRVEHGAVSDFIMNDKCSAGTGRFLEIMANTLGMSPETLCSMAQTGKGVSISSLCTVFAESEVISLIGRGESKENIAFAVVDSIVKKVVSQVKRIPFQSLCLTGGLCEVPYVKKRLEEELHAPIQTSATARYAGAIGAALLARELK